MARILSFTAGPDDWKALLADPEKHWRIGYSARTLAHCWEAADGFPAEVSRALGSSQDVLLRNLSPLLAVPEFKVPLPGGPRASQSDIFVLAKSSVGPVAIMVEGKVNESFGPTLDEWHSEPSPGKNERLSYLLDKLGLRAKPEGTTRYQLIHRAASAVITGEQFRAAAAVLLVHSFSTKNTGWPDYQAFLKHLNVEATQGNVQRIPTASPIPLFAAWVAGDCTYLEK